MNRPSAGETIASLSAAVILGNNSPRFEEDISSTEEGSGFVVFIPTCALEKEIENKMSRKKKQFLNIQLK